MKLLFYLSCLGMLFAYIRAQNDPPPNELNDSDLDNAVDAHDKSAKVTPIQDDSYWQYIVSCNGNLQNFTSSFNSTACWHCDEHRLCLKSYDQTTCAICGGFRTCIPPFINNAHQCFKCGKNDVCFTSN